MTVRSSLPSIATALRDGILIANLDLPPMLYIGNRSFIPVPAQCGIHLQVDPIGAVHSRQVWRIDAAFVPATTSHRPPNSPPRSSKASKLRWKSSARWRRRWLLVPSDQREDLDCWAA